MKGLTLPWASGALNTINNYKLIYNITLVATVFTAFTGVNYLYSNREAISGFLTNE